MVSRLPEDLLSRSAEEAVRLIALDQLHHVIDAHDRLERADDPEALHDLRVALRRLRTSLRLYRAQLEPAAGRRVRRRLRRVARAAGRSRDLEVHLRWLTEIAPRCDPAEASSASLVLDALRARKLEADRRLRRALHRSFRTTPARLERRLRTYHARLSLGPSRRTTGADLIGRRMLEAATQLSRALAAVETADDVDATHAVRIAAKNLRYTLEPAAASRAEVAELIESLRSLQDDLGELHDAQVLLAELLWLRSTDLDHTTSIQPGVEPSALGVGPLTPRLRTRVKTAFDIAKRRWFGGAAEPLTVRIAHLATGLSEPALPREIERKYLLRTLPPHALEAPAADIEQGWLPGGRIVERLRRVYSGGTAQFFRTIKLGAGLSRVEVEEPIDATLFAALWPLTDGLRIAKRRYRVPEPESDLVWEIDELRDHGLVVAEIELPSISTKVAIPEWLTPYVVRDVTGDPSYTNYALAKAGRRAVEPPGQTI